MTTIGTLPPVDDPIAGSILIVGRQALSGA